MGETPLQILCRSNASASDKLHLLPRFSESINVADVNGVTPLHAAVMWLDVQVVQALIDAGAAVDAVDTRGVTPLMLAAMMPVELKFLGVNELEPKVSLLDVMYEASTRAGANGSLLRDITGRTWLHHLCVSALSVFV